MKTFRFLVLACLVVSAFFFSAASGQPAAPARKSLIANGDFEAESTDWPPPGWKVWGGSEWALPENIHLDTDNPQEGKYCLRIHHPANTHGFPVSDPANPIKTAKGMAYLISFWARTDNQAEAGVFYLEAFSSVQPFKDVSSPLRRPIEPSTEWRQYNFQVDEGKDFFADKVKFLLLAFRATRGKDKAQTLWIDNIVVSEVASSEEPLLDPRSLKYEPLNHRLEPGEQFVINVDASRSIGPATRQAGGVSFHRTGGYGRHPYDRTTGEYLMPPASAQAIRDMKLPMTRFYGVGMEKWGLEENLDRLAWLCETYQMPPEWTVVELEPVTAGSMYAPEFWARAVQYCKDKGYKFRFWEVANEPYTRKATAFENPDQYAEHVQAVSEAIRAIQPDAQIGIGIHSSTQPWGTYLLKKAAGSYDFVVGHYYDSRNPYTNDLETIALADNYRMLDHILSVNAVIRHFNPDKDAYQLDTEWGLGDSAKPGDETDARYWRDANIFGTLHRAVRMIYYARESMLRGASGWEMFARPHYVPFAFLTQDHPDKRFMLYWLYYYFNRHCGDVALDITGTAPWYIQPSKAGRGDGPITPALVTLSEDEKSMYFVIANGSWDNAYPCSIKLSNFQASRAVGRYLSQDDPDANPLVDKESDVVKNLPIELAAGSMRFTVPAHSVVFITLE